ncbi:MAG: hypothetical protein KBH99_08860, partial [Syntrophobacteraceae bacterium]|nr:hypothetical protein [Syntrophobacteraceae bacterium]
DLSGSQAAGFREHPLQKRDELALAVLPALAQLQLQTPALPAQGGCLMKRNLVPGWVGLASLELRKAPLGSANP